MSLVGVWSGNFHQLRSILGSGCNSKLLRFQTCADSGTLAGNGRCNLRTITTDIVGRKQKSERSNSSGINWKILAGKVGSSTKLHTYQSELHESKGVQYYNLQQKFVENKIFELPATVLVFDIETTGISRHNERIIEIAIRDILGGVNSTFQTLVNPEKKILNSYVHGISTHMVNRPDVLRMEDLIPILIQYVRSRQMAGKPVLWVAHNGRCFDVPFIIKEFSRCFSEVPSDWFFVDTLPLARQLVKPDGSKLSSVSLEALSKHYEIPLVGRAHRAMQDVTTLCFVLQKMSFELKLSVAELLERAFQASDITKI